MNEKLEKLNSFTRRNHTEDEVYIFDLILCDNEIDRDTEKFSDNALETLKELFVGVTGVFDHEAKSANQTARIFETQIVVDENRKTQDGDFYKYLKASAYMIRTVSNGDLIKEIEGGIKKEVSVSCNASAHICSICGADKRKKACVHVKGTYYDGKKCYVVLDSITDAYEWSFVAVPAQPEAGVVKGLKKETTIETETETETQKQAFPLKTDEELIKMTEQEFTDYIDKTYISEYRENQGNKKPETDCYKTATPYYGDNGSDKIFEIMEKRYSAEIENLKAELSEQDKYLDLLESDLRRDIVKLCTVKGSEPYSKFIEGTVEKLNIAELMDIKKSLSTSVKSEIHPQLYDSSNYKVGG